MPSDAPSLIPSILPSAHPTQTITPQIVSGRYEQRLFVSTDQIFSEEEIKVFQYLYEKYTANFGYNVSTPDIITNCTLTGQSISQDTVNVTLIESSSGLVRKRILTEAYVLSVTFTMLYQTRSQKHDISDYNTLFKVYINQNTTKVAEDMALLRLPVVYAQGVIMVGFILIALVN